MSLARAILLVTSIGSAAYAIGLVAVPGVLADLHAGPDEADWVRYLVPLYAGLAVVAWAAAADPFRLRLVAWGLVVSWGGLAVAHMVNMALGDEPVAASTVGLLVFDAAMAAALATGLLRQRDRSSVTTP